MVKSHQWLLATIVELHICDQRPPVLVVSEEGAIVGQNYCLHAPFLMCLPSWHLCGTESWTSVYVVQFLTIKIVLESNGTCLEPEGMCHLTYQGPLSALNIPVAV